jgi:hypothetical protein
MKQSRLGTAVLLLAMSALSCGSGLRTSGVVAILPGDVSSKLSKGVLDVVEVLPANIEGFGYLDFGAPLDQLLAMGPDYQGMIDDLTAMAKRRWNFDPHTLSGIGVLAFQHEPLIVGELGEAVALPTSSADFATAKLGKLTVGGKPAVVQAFVAASAQQPRLVKARVEWVKHALGHAAGKAAFYSASAEALMADASAKDKGYLAHLQFATVTFSGSEGAAYMLAKPGQVGELQKPLDAALASGRSELAAHLATMPLTAEMSLAKTLIQHYATALFSGLSVKTSGDELTVALPWRTPSLPALTAAPSLQERVVAKDEWAVLQLHLGAPMMQLAIALSDVLGAPLDRAKLGAELISQLSQLLDVPAVDPRTATVSVGGASALVSLHTDHPTGRGSAFAIGQGKMMAAPTPWGLVITASQLGDSLSESLARAPAGLPLATSSKVASKSDAFFRATVDLERLPLMARAFVGDLPLRTVEVSASSAGFSAEVAVKPGQLAAVQQILTLAKDSIATAVEGPYRKRQEGSAEQEAMAIAQYHQAKLVARVLTPKVEGDRMTFSYAWSASIPRGVPIMAGVGVLSAVAIPAFMTYMRAARL